MKLKNAWKQLKNKLSIFFVKHQNGVKKIKAGVLPYIKTDQGLEFLFMIPSDPFYGGDKPQISKGHMDKGETPLESAIREGEEEIGLKKSNIKSYKKFKSKIQGMQDSYIMYVYAIELKDKNNFGKVGRESTGRVWINEKDINQVRKSQYNIVKHFLNVL